MHESVLEAIAEFEDTYWWFVGKNRILERLISRHAPATELCSLDVGCGPGGTLAYLSTRGRAIGADLSQEARAHCRERGFETVHGALPDQLPFDHSSFDVIVASDVIEHVQDDHGSAATLVRLLRPSGVLFVTVPAVPWLWSAHDELNHHFRRYTKARLAALFRGEDVETVILSYYNTAFFPLMVAARLAAKLRPTPETLEIRTPPGPVNRAMARVFAAEALLLGRIGLPIGGSLIGVFRRRKAHQG